MIRHQKSTSHALINVLFNRKVDVQKEFEDFTEESRQLEQELETTLIQNEKQLRDASQSIDSLRDENQTLRVSVPNDYYN